jgi:hypothetical protein
VVVLAQEEARLLNHNYIGTEHILLGLIHEGEGVAAKALESLGISLEAVRAQVEEIIGHGGTAPSGHIPFTPRAKKVLELSLREALQLGHNYIGTEHILLGLIREGEGVAAQVLVKLGADLSRVRQQVIQLRSGYAASFAAAAGIRTSDARVLPALRKALVAPFYRKMMGRGATRESTADFLADVARVGRTTSAEDVVLLLNSCFLDREMGAWFALLHDEGVVTRAVVRALATSVGGLDSRALGTSAVLLAGDAAIPALEVYAANDATDERACGFAAACIEHLGGRPNPAWSIDAEDRRTLAEMLQVAVQLRNL